MVCKLVVLLMMIEVMMLQTSKMKEFQKLLEQKEPELADGVQACRGGDDDDYGDEVVDEKDEGMAEAAGREEP